MIKGIFKTVIYYVIGLGLAGISYLITGEVYVHGPGLHHALIIFTFIGGLLWLLGSVLKYFTPERSDGLKGIILTNLIMILAFVAFMTYIIRSETSDNFADTETDKLIIKESGDTTTVYYHKNIVYYKIGDSVKLNFIDSVKLGLKEE
ncbi:MAG: hypothetical protein JNL40_00285 [Cyclobacteriaceae bacterium]|nr:hypothetical protein [Cyclobacteriaceae bacterium]